MEFASFAYLAFLAVAAVIYFALPTVRLRNAWLLIASIAFYYSLSAQWSVVLAAVIATGYVAGLLLDLIGDRRKLRAAVATTAILTVVGILAVFKYAGFAATSANSLLHAVGSPERFTVLALVLPVGVSFWTFQTIAYVCDVAKAKTRPERDPIRYALFIAFFGHVTAGPIARAGQLMPQLAERKAFSYEAMRYGLLLMGWGFFKKLMVADPMGVFVDFVYRNPHKFGGMTNGAVLLAATVAFSIQIYCDFSGYTDIVRGSARIFGIDLAENFRRPYFSRSVKEFWQRWHMSLMGWLRDHIYIPLGGSRVPVWRRYMNVVIVFLVSGLWHGAGLTFIAWGLLNAFFQIAGDLTRPLREKLTSVLRLDVETLPFRAFQTVVTFMLITQTWVFFRAKSLADGVYISARMWIPTLNAFSDATFEGIELTTAQVIVMLVSALIVFTGEALSARIRFSELVLTRPLPIRWATYIALILALAVFGRYGPAYDASGFAYFRF